ncbi:haloacid dehalogenase-like hydrolase [Streptomyces roseifaciens]|uniref:haloacid dehalogenase-like hydrolase n=1 Tax=Streptomyces roseifaciens TaxID=1488406 RepID=UPI000717E560|nr:haloacid dehalogenase-like hydrolase [Streptomyces roseifaciens]
MRTKSAIVVGLAAAAALATTVPATAAPSHDAPRRNCPQLDKKLPWAGDNRARLQKMIDERGTCSGKKGPRPVAAFDWDNTVVKNDITDATLAWALKHDKILQPKSWKDTSAWLTPAADKALAKACGTAVRPGRPLPTSRNTACADEIFEIREKSQTMAGDAAFAGDWNHRRTVPAYAWIPQLFAGHTPAALNSFAKQARAEQLAAPVGTKQTVGTHTLAGYVRYYDQQKDLIRTLKAAGFDVYIVSASSEPIAEAWSSGVGLDRKHTIGIRSITKHGRLTTAIKGCGGVETGRGDALPYMDGKRCMINQEIFKIKGAKAWQQQDFDHRIALGAGDADTDVTFVNDATGAHVAINRNKSELMCRAYDDADRRWVANPMFIEPMPRKSGTYPCSTTGATAEDGTKVPVRRADGSVIPDQADKAF